MSASATSYSEAASDEPVRNGSGGSRVGGGKAIRTVRLGSTRQRISDYGTIIEVRADSASCL